MAMRFLSLLALSSAAVAEWNLYCGDSCSDGTLVASSSSIEDTCASLGGTYDYCYLEADADIYQDLWEAVFYEKDSCAINADKDGYAVSSDIFNGECTAAGSWTAYHVVLNA